MGLYPDNAIILPVSASSLLDSDWSMSMTNDNGEEKEWTAAFVLSA